MSVVKYTHDEMADLIQKMSMIFDIVRLVDRGDIIVRYGGDEFFVALKL